MVTRLKDTRKTAIRRRVTRRRDTPLPATRNRGTRSRGTRHKDTLSPTLSHRPSSSRAVALPSWRDASIKAYLSAISPRNTRSASKLAGPPPPTLPGADLDQIPVVPRRKRWLGCRWGMRAIVRRVVWPRFVAVVFWMLAFDLESEVVSQFQFE
ncbi:hypothetical protein ZIOFF_069068 [Zingiber officinale]|uniref:Uncharacterized protein n=1 Tax=Zingiber officinale TaxID=94328 RepID=A0A8J5CD75_ZINOF|nr:hypothetical protein ZIOFF_069068 [Zingiber officinale]